MALSCVLLLSGCSMVAAPSLPANFATPSSSTQQSDGGDAVENLQTCLLGRWMHSHEEDIRGTAIYRPREYEFPSARGRTGFDFIASGKTVYYGIADTDGVKELSGRWETRGSDGIKITFDEERIQPIVLHVLTCDADKLVVRS
jgi:hypothetical protein